MGNRFYTFFSVMRMSMLNKQLEFSAPGNSKIHRVLVLFRAKGLIAGFSLDFDKNKKVWSGYPQYKVYLKYNYIGVPVIKKMDFYQLTKTNYNTIKKKYPIMSSSYWLVLDKVKGISFFGESLDKNSKLLAKIKT